jgi:5-methylcytosine-specific restriction endonuclease McrA
MKNPKSNKNNDWIYINKDKSHIAKEKIKLLQFKKTTYYKNLLQSGECYYCNNTFPSDQLTLDHIVPLARGGKSTKGNLVLACFDCNQKKGLQTPVDIILNNL